MKNHVFFALSISLILVGGAAWLRFSKNPETSATLVASEATRDEFVSQFFDLDIEYASSTPLSESETVSRQLIMDYVDLAAKGQATPENIAKLANQYSENIAALTSAEVISTSDIVAVKASVEAYQNYEAQMNQAHQDSASSLAKRYPTRPNITDLGPEFQAFASTLSTEYSTIAAKLRRLPTPEPLVSVHTRLINSYLLSAASYSALASAIDDPTIAFAGIAAINSNLLKEKALSAEISRIINGVLNN